MRINKVENTLRIVYLCVKKKNNKKSNKRLQLIYA